MRIRIATPTPAMGVSLVALVVALGGTAYAAALPRNSVGSLQLKRNAVTTAKIRAGAVSGIKLSASSVTSAKIRDLQVTSAKLADGAVTTGKLADGSVTTGKLAPNSVSAAQLIANSVTSPHVVDGGIAAADLAANSVATAAIQDNAVTQAKIADNAVNSAKVENGTLLKADVAAGQFTGGTITVQRTDVDLPDNSGAVPALATCLPGQTIIGGGATIAASTSIDITLTVSRPYLSTAVSGLPNDGEGFDSWRVVAVNPPGGTGATTLRSYAICAA